MKQPKPFFRKFTGTWYVQVGTKQINLGPDKKEAYDRFHQLMRQPRPRKVSSQSLVDGKVGSRLAFGRPTCKPARQLLTFGDSEIHLVLSA